MNAKDPFIALWADGDPNRPSVSKLYFGDSTGERYWVLPYEMEEEDAEPELVSGPAKGRR